MNTLGIIMIFLSYLLLLILHCSCSFFVETRKREGSEKMVKDI